MSKTQLVRALRSTFPEETLLTEDSECWAYSYDNSRKHVMPDAVVFPTDTAYVQKLVKFSIEHNAPLVPRGRGTGTPGGSVPMPTSIVVSFERMNKILDFQPNDRIVSVEPGVINQTLQEHVGHNNFFWPPDPSSAAACTIGGNLAYNSAGPRAVKYGTPRENTLALTAVTGTGEVIRTGCITTKGVVGYDLTRLLIGSEGTLALITEATLKLTVCPETKHTLQFWYDSIEGATAAIVSIMSGPFSPCAMEWMDTHSVALVRDNTALEVPQNAKSLLIVEVDGAESSIHGISDAVFSLGKNHHFLDGKKADTKEAVKQLWAARKALSPLLRKISPKKINEDVVVPVTAIPEFIEHLVALSERTQIPIVNFGHAGNGNIHVNLLVDPNNMQQMSNLKPALESVFDKVLALGGTLSGEHGVGLDKKAYISKELGETQLELMRQIKKVFDPHRILNPGKIFD